MKNPTVIALLVVIASSTAWCQKRSPSREGRDWVVVVPHATDVQQRKLDSRVQLSYRVQAAYPANEVLAALSNRLKALGWEPLREDFLNPGLPSSHVRGWDYYEDHATQPHTSVRVWQGDWQDAEREVITYRLEYRCPDNQCASTADLANLRLIGLHLPAALADRLRKETTRR